MAVFPVPGTPEMYMHLQQRFCFILSGKLHSYIPSLSIIQPSFNEAEDVREFLLTTRQYLWYVRHMQIIFGFGQWSVSFNDSLASRLNYRRNQSLFYQSCFVPRCVLRSAARCGRQFPLRSRRH